MKKLEPITESLLDESKYLEDIKSSDLPENVKAKMTLLVNERNEVKREKHWNELIKITNPNNFKLLVNNYYIGYGNPNADILFIGQEKAFNLNSNTDLLLRESINNNYYWNEIIENGHRPLDFNPEFPKGYSDFKRDFASGHTWNLYSKVIASFYNLNSSKLFNENEDVVSSLFNYCFTTEINAMPKKKNEKDTIKNSRREFLKNKFFKSFKYVVVGASTSLGKNQKDIIKSIFDAECLEDKYSLGTYGKNNSKTRTVSLYQSNEQTIMVCNQLSGSAGWKNEHLEKFSEVFRLYEKR